MRSWANVATLAKTRNLDGGFVVKSTAGLPFLMEEGMEVAFVPPREDAVRRTTVADVVPIDEHSAEVHFADVVGIDEARRLVGCCCLVRRADLDEDDLDSMPARWEGWTVVDGQGRLLGNVAGIVENPAQMLLKVDRADDVPGKGELLIPAVDEIVVDVDPEALSAAEEAAEACALEDLGYMNNFPDAEGVR